MKTFLALSITVISFLIFNSCDTTEPIADEITPGRRDYTWTIDTLNYPNATLSRIWGSSPTDVWATSPGDWDKSISHYDGEKWSSYGVSGMNVPSSIYGFSSTDIYIGTMGGGIWHYDGGSWTKIVELTKDGHSDIVFSDIWGETTTDFYISGAYPDSIIGAYNNSVIAHYYNEEWTLLTSVGLVGIVGHFFKCTINNKFYIETYRLGGSLHPDSSLIFEYSGGKYNEIYSSIWTKGLQASISLIDGEVYFILGNKIAKRESDAFQTFLQVDNSNFYQRIWGRNSKDIFLGMTDGLAHYNGSDVEYLLDLSKNKILVGGAALFEKEVFFMVYESSTNLNLIYHGKLN